MSEFPEYEPAEKIYAFIVNDFVGIWNSLDRNPLREGGGLFTLGWLSALFLEWSCRLCAKDESALNAFAEALNGRDRRYFIPVPGRVLRPRENQFRLPTLGVPGGDPVLWLVWDLIRNGLAHAYQQIPLTLRDGRVAVSLIGAEPGAGPIDEIERSSQSHRLKYHLRPSQVSEVLWIGVCPDLLFLDIRAAIEAAGLLRRGLIVSPFGRGYDFSAAELLGRLA